MKAALFEQFGDPKDVLRIREAPLPQPGRGEVRVRMLASPINPSDLLYVRGQYGRRPQLPSSAGFEGVGIVEEAGPGILARMRRGRRVAVLSGKGGNWQEQVIVSARQVVPVPAALSDEQAASFFVNPATALLMTKSVLGVPQGAWLLQTAAGSALGRMVIGLGKHFGFRTINVVRRREQAQELLKLGGDAVICTAEESIEEKVRKLTEGTGVRYAIDAVGGETGSAVLRSLGEAGHMLVYGTLSEEPMSISPRVLMDGQKRLEGFWLSIWARQQNPLRMLRLFRKLGKLMVAGVLKTEIGETFPFERVADAAHAAAQPGKKGKVLMRIAKA